jgi:hypothetical protein
MEQFGKLAVIAGIRNILDQRVDIDQELMLTGSGLFRFPQANQA